MFLSQFIFIDSFPLHRLLSTRLILSSPVSPISSTLSTFSTGHRRHLPAPRPHSPYSQATSPRPLQLCREEPSASVPFDVEGAIQRFRPNVVVKIPEGTEAFEEDGWGGVGVGAGADAVESEGLGLEVVGRCGRCTSGSSRLCPFFLDIFSPQQLLFHITSLDTILSKSLSSINSSPERNLN